MCRLTAIPPTPCRPYLLLGLLLLALLVLPASSPPASAAPSCEFALGFKALHDMIPGIVGDCVVDEHHNPLNGDGLQETTGVAGKGGLLVWRKADNWTAYTDGFRTWVNGPYGLRQRLNIERFCWEADAVCIPQCCKVCTTGNKACGHSCISRWDTCRQPPGCACDAN